jgi:hypothetical protein
MANAPANTESTRQSGEYNHVSHQAKSVPLTVLKNPIVRKFPTARSKNTRPSPHAPASKKTARGPVEIQPAFPITTITADASNPHTIQVATGPGSKLRRPRTMGTV